MHVTQTRIQLHSQSVNSVRTLSASTLCRTLSYSFDGSKNRTRFGSEIILTEECTHSRNGNLHGSSVRRHAEMRERQSPDPEYSNTMKSIILGGFLVAEMPIIRQTLDEAGAYDIQMIVSHPDLLDVSVGNVLRYEQEPEWLHPVPDVWVDGGGWGKRRVLLCHNVPRVNQLEIVQILYDIGIPPRIDAMSLDGSMIFDDSMKLGDVFAMAVDMCRQSADDVELVFDDDDDYYYDDDDDIMVEEGNNANDDDDILSPCIDLSPDILHLTAIDDIAERTAVTMLDMQDNVIDDDHYDDD